MLRKILDRYHEAAHSKLHTLKLLCSPGGEILALIMSILALAEQPIKCCWIM